MCAVLVQEQAQAARKRAAGTMDEYTFIAEDTEAADQAGSVPAIQQVSSEELYRKELAEEMQVPAAHSQPSCGCTFDVDLRLLFPKPPNKDIQWYSFVQLSPRKECNMSCSQGLVMYAVPVLPAPVHCRTRGLKT